MSYLPRMSKTYREPPEPLLEELEETSINENAVRPASSLLNEATHNPQAALKHYKYLPHPPPVLPGPSVAEEAQENELFREASKQRRSMSKMEVSEHSKMSLNISTSNPSEATLAEENLKPEASRIVKHSQSKKVIKGSRTSVSRKKSSRNAVEKTKESPEKPHDLAVNVCLIESDFSKSFAAAQTEASYRNEGSEDKQLKKFQNKDELKFLRRERFAYPLSNSDLPEKTDDFINKSSGNLLSKEKVSEVKSRDVTNKSVQCTIFGSAEKKIVISPVIHSLLRALAFLLHELNREEAVSRGSGEKRRLLNQIQLILGDLSNQNIDKEFCFDMTYSDSKRMEKIHIDLQRYIKDIYGTKGQILNKIDDLKKVFIDLKIKEMEYAILNEKLEENETIKVIEVKENDLKYPEITLQNKKLESEQLIAEVEFSCREVQKYQKTLAEIDWEIKNNQEKLSALKKSFASKSKTEIPGKKASVHRFSNESQTKDNKNK